MKRWTLVLTFAFLALVLLGITVAAQMEGNSVESPLARPQLRIAHLAPFAADPGTAVTVTVNGEPYLTGVEFADSTPYDSITPRTYLVEVFTPGSATPIISSSVYLTTNVDYTLIAVGGANGWPPELTLLEDDDTPPASGYAKVQIGHLAPFAALEADTLADVRLQDGTVILDDVPYGAIDDYLELPAGDYDLKITTPDGTVTLIGPMPLTLTDGDILSAFAVGDGTNQPLGVFAWPIDQAGFLLPLPASLRIAHLAPFAADPGTAVTVTVDGAPLLAGIEFADSTAYQPISAGVDHLIEIFPPGSTTAAISATVNLTEAMEFTAIAVGGANDWPLDLTLLEDDNTPPTSGFAKVQIGHLAPFAVLEADTLADVRLQDGTVILDDVPYGAIADYLELAAGDYDLKITTPDGTVTLIDPGPVTLNDGDILSAFAVGDGTNQPLGVFAWPSNQIGFLLPMAEYQLYLPLVLFNAP